MFHDNQILLGAECEGEFPSGLLAYRLRILFPRLFLIAFWRSQKRRTMTGFKYIWFSSCRARESILFKPIVKKVLLSRRNILRAEVSRQIADETNEWSSSSDPKRPNTLELDIDNF